MDSENIIVYIFGKIVKWFFLIGALDFVFLIFYTIVESNVDGIG